jgi:hypothetical protein
MRYVANLKKIVLLINNSMRNNNITPLTNIDFAASIAELKPLLINNLVALPRSVDWSELYYIAADANDLPITTNTLANLNLAILNLYYVERRSSPEDYYEEAVPRNYIILPLVEADEIATIASAYSAPLNSTRLPNNPTLYNPEDCTLLKSHPLNEPAFIGCDLEDAELVYCFKVPEDEVFKAIAIVVTAAQPK